MYMNYSSLQNTNSLDATVWGPHFWFFLHTIALHYPKNPNATTKKKYYELIENLPLFIPVESMATDFTHLLNEYPLVPYLDNRDSLIRWMHFIHNKVNEKLEKPKISLSDFYIQYYNEFKPKNVKRMEYLKTYQRAIYFGIIFVLLACIYWLYSYR